MEYSKDDQVIIRCNNHYEVGNIFNVKKSKTKILYDIITEKGSIHYGVSTNKRKKIIYIDVKKTDKFKNKIKSTLKSNSYEITGIDDQ